MKPEADVRNDENEWTGSANLIFHQGVADIFHKTVNPLCILGNVKEVREIVSGFNRVHSLVNIFQFPGNPRASDSVLDLQEYGLTVPVRLLSLFPSLSQQSHPEG